MVTKEKNGRFEIYDFDDSTDNQCFDDIQHTEANFVLYSGEDTQPHDIRNTENFDQLDRLHNQTTDSRSSDANQEFSYEPLAHLSFPTEIRPKRRVEKSDIVTIDDFDSEEERVAAHFLISAFMTLEKHKKYPKEALEAAKWVFNEPNSSLTFEDCCYVHEARPEVIRLRFQFEFWRQSIVFPEFKLSDTQACDIAQQKAFAVGGFAAMNIINTVWRQPSIKYKDLIKRIDKKNHHLIDILLDSYVLSESSTKARNIYVTGINPIRQDQDRPGTIARPSYRIDRTRRNEFSWSSQFKK